MRQLQIMKYTGKERKKFMRKTWSSIFKEVASLIIMICMTFSAISTVFADENPIQMSGGLELMTYDDYWEAMENIDNQVETIHESTAYSDNSTDPVKIDKPLPLSIENLDSGNAEENIFRIDEDGNPLLMLPLTAPEIQYHSQRL